MKKNDALELSLAIDEMCIENSIEVNPEDNIRDVTIKMVKKQDGETLSEIYERFQGRSSNLAAEITAAIEEERRSRTID